MMLTGFSSLEAQIKMMAPPKPHTTNSASSMWMEKAPTGKPERDTCIFRYGEDVVITLEPLEFFAPLFPTAQYDTERENKCGKGS